MSEFQPTLYEDWRRRREHLAASADAWAQIHRAARLRVLDQLLERYRDKAEAAGAARFPFCPGLLLTHRAAVVHQYLGGRAVIASHTQPGIRAAVILGRVASVHPHSDSTPRSSGGAAGWLLAQVEARSVYWSSGYWQNEVLAQIGKAIQATLGERYVYLTVLDRLQLGPKLPDWAIMYMFEQLDKPGAATDSAAGLFVCCENECVLDYAMLAWRDRLAANGPDSVTRGLTQVFRRPHWQDRAAEKIRVELASHNPVVRVEAASLLTELGSLHDAALLLDLLALPPLHDEEPSERDVLMQALGKLTGVAFEPLSGAEGSAVLRPGAGHAATLYDDWLLRRRRLTHVLPMQHPFAAEHRAVLDGLLERWRNTPRAAQPARFAAPPQPFLDRRALMIFHRCGKSDTGGTVTATEAGKRASSILQRIRGLDPQSSARDFAASGVLPQAESAAKGPAASATTPDQARLWQEIEERITRHGLKEQRASLYARIAAALELGPQLPEQAVYYLAQHLDNPDAVALLSRCSRPAVLEYIFGAWRQRVLRKRRGPVNLTGFFMLPAWREKAAEKFRRELVAGESAKARARAACVLGRLGSLDDVGLLSDLLSLPRWKNEDARERPAILQALRRLAR